MGINKIKYDSTKKTIGIICPAGHINDFSVYNKFKDILINEGYNIKEGVSVNSACGYLGGTDEVRAKDIMDMFIDDSVFCILCYKGGYGTQRLLPFLDYKEIEKHPKLFVGFSDITVLLNVFYEKCNFPTVHGMMGVCLNGYDEGTINRFLNLLKGKVDNNLTLLSNPFETVSKGVSEGILVGGNLSLVYALMGTKYEIDLKDKILLLEDVDEAPYSIDRMLSSLTLSKDFDKLKGVIFGYFTRCNSEKDQQVDDLIKHYFGKLNIPVIKNYPSGHSSPFVSSYIGLKVKLDTENKVLELKEPFFK